MEIFPGLPSGGERNEAQTARNRQARRAAERRSRAERRSLHDVSLETLTEAIFGPITIHVSFLYLSLSRDLSHTRSLFSLRFMNVFIHLYIYI